MSATNQGLWLAPEDDPRTTTADPRGERAVLEQYLRHYRLTLELKCQGLTAEQLATRSVPPSTLSLLGLVRHLARVEHSWWRRVVEGHPELPRLYGDTDGDVAFLEAVGTEQCVSDAWESWRAEVAHGESVYAASELGALVDVKGDLVEVRDVVVHLVEEYARHLGHADLLRECLDGRTGQ